LPVDCDGRTGDIRTVAKVQQQGQKPAKNAEPVAVAEPVKSPYHYFVPGEKPRTDAAYFELLLAKLLRTSGEFPNFDDVWPVAVQSLAGMNLLRLSTYSTVELRDAIVTVGGEFNTRMNAQAEAIIRWAQSLWRIRQIYGTFRRYLRSFDVDGFEALLEDLKVRLPGLSAEFITAFLRDAGEKVPVPEKVPSARQQQQRGGSPQDGRGGDQRRQQQQPQKQQQPQSPQQQQQQPKQEGGRNDRRRRQRGRGGARPQQQDPQAQKQQPAQQQAQRQPQVEQPAQANSSVENSSGDDAGKDPQQQRRRNRRRFFRRRRSGGGGDSTGAPSAPTS
jgi:hypothetical protein